MNKRIPRRNQQSGAVLYVALIMLILLALIGIVGMQVAGLQERMSANYQASNLAFQNAERDARLRENLIEAQVNAGSDPVTNLPPNDCVSTQDLEAWSDPVNPYVRRLDLCFSWGGLDAMVPLDEKTDQIYQITAFERDRAVLASSEAVISTVYIP